MGFPLLANFRFRAPNFKSETEKIKKGFRSISKTAKSIKNTGPQLAAGIQGMTLATTPLAAGVLGATSVFAGFEKQMSVVKSLTGDISNDTFKAMNNEAKRLGATTAFSATQAAEGMQFLALAGFNAEDQISSVGTVLDLAAAGSISLASASDIATDSLSAMAPAFDKNMSKVQNLTRLTDQMAFIQSKTNTNVTQLGEAIKFGGGAMASANIPLEQILASMGALANAGLKGSIGGTALTNMFNKLAKPSSKASAIMKKYNVQLKDSDGNFKSMPKLLTELNKVFSKVDGGANQAAIANELFGVRGQRAFFALKNEGGEAIQALMDGLLTSVGAASKQSAERIDNLAGSFTILKSASEAVLIEVGGVFSKLFRGGIDEASFFLGNVATAFQLVNAKSQAEVTDLSIVLRKSMGEENAKTIVRFVTGFKEGFKEASETVKQTMNDIKDAFKSFTGSDLTTKEIGKMIAKIVVFGTIAAPLLIGLSASIFVLGPIFSGIGGLITAATIIFKGFLSTGMGIGKFLLSPLAKSKIAIFALKTKFASVVSFFSTKIAFLKGIFTPLGGLFKNIGMTALKFLLSPWFLIPAAIIGTLAVIWIYRDEIKAALKTAGEFIIGVWDSVSTSAIENFTALKNGAGKLWDGMVEGFKTKGTQLKEFLSSVFTSIGKMIKETFDKVTNFKFPSVGGILSSFTGGLFGGEDGKKPNNVISFKKPDSTFVESDKKPKFVEEQSKTNDAIKQAMVASNRQTIVSNTPKVIINNPVQSAAQSNANQPPINVVVKSILQTDDRQIATSVARQQVQNSERQGIDIQPGEKRKILESGSSIAVGE